MKHRILAILKQEIFIIRHSFEIIADIVVYPLVSIIVFGYLSLYLLGNARSTVAHSIMMGTVLWQVIFIVQYSIAVGALWNMWWRNLSNLFVTPLSMREYILALTLSSLIKATIILLLGSLIAYYVFGFNMFAVGYVNLILFIVNLIIFGFCFGIIILGFIFRFGQRIQALAWGMLPLFQPLTATFYPASVLPQPLRTIAFLLPPTHIFEALRATLKDGGIHFEYILPAFGINIIFLTLSILFFKSMYQAARESGQFARNEG